jgi:hypothetical protein
VTTEDQDLDIKVQQLADGLLEATPEEWDDIRCLISRSVRQCGSRLEYEISSPKFPDDVHEEPSRTLHEAAHESLRGHPDVEGIELSMQRTDEDNWSLGVQVLYPEESFDRKRHDEDLWDHVYDSRMEYLQQELGTFPEDILKLMTVHWPGGGLFRIENSKIDGSTAFLSCGLSNPDMPAPAYIEEFERVDGPGGQKSYQTKLGWRVPIWCPPSDSGYGYEFLLLSKERDLIVPLMGFVEQELNFETDWMYRVRTNGGMTIEEMPLGDGESCDMILAPARMFKPIELASGNMEILVATRVTREEMNFARNGKINDLLDLLYKAGHGQVSVWDRESVV